MFKRIESLEDRARGLTRYDLGDGRMVCLKQEDVQQYGLGLMLQRHGVALPSERVPVWQDGDRIGSMPWDFDPEMIRSLSPLYDPKSSDFRREPDGWIASDALGPGDLDAVPGFMWEE